MRVHRAPLRSEERHDHANVVGHRRVEPRRGLVEEEDGRARDEREPDVHTLLLPARDARDQLAADDGLAAILEPKLADHLLAALELLRARQRGELQLGRVHEHLLDGEDLHQVIELLDVAAEVLDVLLIARRAGEADLALDGARVFAAGQHIHQARLPAAACAEKGRQATWLEAATDAVQNHLRALLLAKVDTVREILEREGDLLVHHGVVLHRVCTRRRAIPNFRVARGCKNDVTLLGFLLLARK